MTTETAAPVFAAVHQVREGTKLIVDGGFTCMTAGETRTVQSDSEGLFVYCADGKHYIDGQLDEGEVYVGLSLADPEAAIGAEPGEPPSEILIEDREHLLLIGRTMGVMEVVQLLDTAEPVFLKLPGYHAAQAMVAARGAELRAVAAGANIRAAARAGIDIIANEIALRTDGSLVAQPVEDAEGAQ